MREVELSWIMALKVLWLISWRGMVGGALFGFLAGFALGFSGSLAGLADQQRNLLVGTAVLIFTPIWWIVVLRMAFRKEYRGFRLAVIEDDSL